MHDSEAVHFFLTTGILILSKNFPSKFRLNVLFFVQSPQFELALNTKWLKLKFKLQLNWNLFIKLIDCSFGNNWGFHIKILDDIYFVIIVNVQYSFMISLRWETISRRLSDVLFAIVNHVKTYRNYFRSREMRLRVAPMSKRKFARARF